MKITILNSSNILSSFGTFNYKPISLNEAKVLIADGFESAVDNQSDCEVLTKVLDVSVPMNKLQYLLTADDVALIFKLKVRPEEGKILSVKEIEEIGYEFGVIYKIR